MWPVQRPGAYPRSYVVSACSRLRHWFRAVYRVVKWWFGNPPLELDTFPMTKRLLNPSEPAVPTREWNWLPLYPDCLPWPSDTLSRYIS